MLSYTQVRIDWQLNIKNMFNIIIFCHIFHENSKAYKLRNPSYKTTDAP